MGRGSCCGRQNPDDGLCGYHDFSGLETESTDVANTEAEAVDKMAKDLEETPDTASLPHKGDRRRRQIGTDENQTSTLEA
ncbi:hypothetical protein N7520_011822 [Penicillium odoratum]|uniref:uncharacterized protein n=1 Tax=Penicillium odoratum TaxID=1167516 RepID=UPI0025486238|nr:uncharacterized protein N7520_011822 [Penicillium odoratum]KAJ5746640.1 hypothetical protein N7520_011822 [Penicillium odoratum]